MGGMYCVVFGGWDVLCGFQCVWCDMHGCGFVVGGGMVSVVDAQWVRLYLSV